MSRRKVDEIKVGSFTARILKDSEWNEYVVQYFLGGEHIGEDDDSDSFCEDKKEAQLVAKDTLNRYNKNMLNELKKRMKSLHSVILREYQNSGDSPSVLHIKKNQNWFLFLEKFEDAERALDKIK